MFTKDRETEILSLLFFSELNLKSEKKNLSSGPWPHTEQNPGPAGAQAALTCVLTAAAGLGNDRQGRHTQVAVQTCGLRVKPLTVPSRASVTGNERTGGEGWAGVVPAVCSSEGTAPSPPAPSPAPAG